MSPQRRQKGTGSLFQRADGTWVGVVEIKTGSGQRKQKRVSSKNRNDAMKKLRDLKAAIDAGIDPSAGQVKVSQYLDHWLDKVHRYRVKPSTFPGQERTVRLYIKPHIGAIRLDRLTPVDVRNMIEQLRPTSTSIAAKAHQVLGSALSQAVKDGLIIRNVVDAVDKPRHRPEIHPAFTAEETLHIIRTAESSSDEIWTARWAAGFMTGLRESELLGLEWDRVDFDRNVLDVSWQLQQFSKSHGCGEPTDGAYPCRRVRSTFCPNARWEFNDDFEYRPCVGVSLWTRPKSQRSNREVPIMTPLRPILERISTCPYPNPHGLVFRHPDGAPIQQRHDQIAWTQLLKDAGLEHRRQHTMRRTAATLLRANDVDEQSRMELMGHASTDVQRLYAGSDLALKHTMIEKAAHIFKALESAE